MFTFAVGDIHGRFDLLVPLVEKCIRYAEQQSSEFKFVFLGDYVDRGPDSALVVDYLRSWQAREPSQVIMLRGNHEEMFIASARDWPTQEPEEGTIDELFGRPETYRSFVKSEIDPFDAAAFLKTLPSFYDDGRRYFVHAGVRPGVALADQDDEDRLWIRSEFLFSDATWDRYIVHGHSPTKPLGMPHRLPNRLNLDTGACWPDEGGKLTAAIFNDSQTLAIGFAQL